MDSVDDIHTRIPETTRKVWKTWEIVGAAVLIIAVILIAVLVIELPTSSSGVGCNTTLGPVLNYSYYSGYASFALIEPANSTVCLQTALATAGLSCLSWFGNAPIEVQADCEPGYPCCCVSNSPGLCSSSSLTNSSLYFLFSAAIVCM
jgi:hypothetical protein